MVSDMGISCVKRSALLSQRQTGPAPKLIAARSTRCPARALALVGSLRASPRPDRRPAVRRSAPSDLTRAPPAPRSGPPSDTGRPSDPPPPAPPRTASFVSGRARNVCVQTASGNTYSARTELTPSPIGSEDSDPYREPARIDPLARQIRVVVLALALDQHASAVRDMARGRRRSIPAAPRRLLSCTRNDASITTSNFSPAGRAPRWGCISCAPHAPAPASRPTRPRPSP